MRFKKKGSENINSNELKQYIIDNNKIFTILEGLGCHGIKEYINEYRAALPNKTNKTAICIKKDTLESHICCSEIEKHGDIFIIPMIIRNESFGKSNKYLHQLLNLKYEFNIKKPTKEKSDILDIFTKVKKIRHIVNQDNHIYDENILREYIDLPHISWIREGIMPFTCKKFNIGYSYDKKRIIIPWRYWCGDENDYVGIVGRTTIPNYDILGIPKYFGIQPFPKSMNLYGLQENYMSIQSAGYVVVGESEKYVLKRHSRKDETCVAIGSHSISEEQVKILLGLNVDIIISFDKDIDIQTIRKECEKFYKIRNVYYIYDKWDLLNDKMSPSDLPNKKYEFMLKYKIKYDESEHNEYIKYLKKRSRNPLSL